MNRFVAEEDGQPFYWNDMQDAEDDVQPMPEEGAGPSAADTAASQRQARAGDEGGQPPHTRVTPGGRDMEGGRPMSEGREDKLKAMLYPYLEQRMATRAKTYGAEGTQARMAEANGLEEEGRRLALLSGLSEDGAKFGSLHGKIPETSVPAWAQNTMAAAKLGAGARAGVRAEDEKSLGTDLDIGKTIYDGEMDEKKRKDGVRESDLKRQFLYDELEAKKKGGRLGAAAQRDAWAPTDYDSNGQPMIINRTTGETKPLPGARRYVKPSTTSTDPNWQSVEGATGPNGEVVARDPRTGKTRLEQLPPGAKRAPKATPRPPRGPHTRQAEEIESKIVSQEMIADTLTAELQKFDEFMKTDKDLARKHGKGMLKGINSQFGPDAIGNQEAERIGGFLDPIKSPLAEGSMFKVDYDKFRAQVQGKISAIRAAAAMQRKRANDLRAKDGGAGGGGSGGEINVISPDGQPGTIPEEDWEDAEREGYRRAE